MRKLTTRLVFGILVGAMLPLGPAAAADEGPGVHVGVGSDGVVDGTITIGGVTIRPPAHPVPPPAAEIGMPVVPGVPVVTDGPAPTRPPKSTVCRDLTRADGLCLLDEIVDAPPEDPGALDPVPTGPSVGEVVAWAEQAATQLQLPEAQVALGPDPSLNEWNMVGVGYPLWLWLPGGTSITSSVVLRGITLELVAERGPVSFSMGDGQVVHCRTMTPWTPEVRPGAPSPTCGHRYASKPAGGVARIDTTAAWTVTWRAAGLSGQVATVRTGSRTIAVGELVAVVNG